MIIKKAQKTDVKALVKLENETFSDANFPLSRESFYYHIKRNLLLVVYDDKFELLGYALALIHRKKAKLYSLCIQKSYRGSGIAKKLMEQLFYSLNQLNFKIIILEVRQDNYGAINFYKKLGFKQLAISLSFYKDGSNALIMERKIVN
ncbi:ribosomal-protein-alanine N-acetyltransferase [Sulfurimonas lithotrophica]|uniref:[Ribosomal protein bS18]-alanine N-acetyltransferase n=1 Tax=Sulfurimonas lithotrophica TaxID=2590022 RepID=A0A5P8NY16_9BACT|nr:ribosomal-protein-alanine N-acetyltransferase [Sulfurimonas lithotrophica]